MRVILDTNILCSALITPDGPSDRLYRAWRERRFELLFSTEVKAASAASLTDISTASDTFLVELFRETFALKELRYLNAERANFPGLDGDGR